MKLVCVYSNNSFYKVGAIYDAVIESEKYGVYQVNNGDFWGQVILDGIHQKFLLVEVK